MAATAIASRPARRSASSASRRGRSRRCRSRPRSAASGARSSTATGTTGIAEGGAGTPARDRAEQPRGRFAPSPTGRLHVGSLLTAVGSWLDARAAGGEWRIRLEDVDRDREVPGAADAILAALDAFALHWDGPVVRQTARGHLYEAALRRLRETGAAYPCSCTRGEIAALVGPDGRYPGTCRDGPRHPDRPHAWRWRVPAGVVTVTDRLQGPLAQDVADTVGDFVLQRRDGFWSYQLAVVVDDAEQAVTDVVRGLDLWDNTPRQVALQRALGLPTPRYLHLPLVVEPDGTKLAKSRHAVPVELASAPGDLTRVLALLRHPVPAELAGAPCTEQLAWAVGAWQPARLRGLGAVRAGD